MATQAARSANEKFCFDCGSAINARAEICPRCGVRQHAPPGFIVGSTASGKNRIAAALFALILGGVGIHKFYLGRVGQGILYLLFCWTFIPAVIGFIEGIIYLTMSDASFEEKYIIIPTETTRPDTIFPLIKRETVMSPQFKTIMMAVGAFMLAFAIFKPAAPPPPPLSAADQAKIAKYRAEEKEYWAVQAKCGPDASGFACDKTLNDLATLEVRHARWTLAKKFPQIDPEAAWIIKHE